MTAFSELRRFRRQSSFRTWLLTIAWRTAINRRRRVVWWLRRRIEDRADPPATTASPEADAARREMSGALAAEIRSLSPKLRDALLLAGAGQCTYGEIAAMLNVPVGTVKWRVSEARRVLRARMEARGHAV